MAVKLNGRTSASAEYFKLNGLAGISGYPVTFAGWFKADSSLFANNHQLIGFVDEDATNTRLYLQVKYSLPRINILAGTVTDCPTSANWLDDVWVHAAGIAASATDRRTYMNGGYEGSSTATFSWSANLDAIHIGCGAENAYTDKAQLIVAECAIWNVALSIAEIRLLAKGMHPNEVRPENLIVYAPFDSPKNDFITQPRRWRFAGKGLPTYVPHPGFLLRKPFLLLQTSGYAQLIQNISPNGITTAEAFGSPSVLRGNVNVAPNGIVSGQEFGSPTVVPGNVNVIPNGIASAQAFGSPSLTTGNVNVAPNGIASAEAFGASLTVVQGTVYIIGMGIVSAESFGLPTLVFDQGISASSIGSTEAFGSPSIHLRIGSIYGIASAEAVGLPTLAPGFVDVNPLSIVSAESFGQPSIVPGSTFVNIDSIPSGEVFGSPSIAIAITANSINSEEEFGSVNITSNFVLVLLSIESSEVFGSLTLVAGLVSVLPNGITSQERFGSPSVMVGVVYVNPDRIASSESWGDPAVIPGSALVSPNGIMSLCAFGTPSLTVGTVSVSPHGIASHEFVGTPHVMVLGVQVIPYSISSTESFGGFTVVPGRVGITFNSIGSGESFGTPSVLPGMITINPDGIDTSEIFGSINVGLVIRSDSIVTLEMFGTPSLSVGSVNISPYGIASGFASGSHTIRHVLVIDFDGSGIASFESVGTPTVTALIRNAFQALMESDLQQGFFNLGEFAEMAVYIHKDGTTLQLPVIFDHEMQLIDVDAEAEVLSRHPVMQAQSSAFSVHPDKGDKVVIRGVRYQIISHEPDGTGVTNFRLHHERTV